MDRNVDRITIDLKDCQKTLPQLLSSKKLPTLNMKVLLVADFNDDGIEEVLVLITERNKQRLAYFTLSGSNEEYFACPLSATSPAQLQERREYFSSPTKNSLAENNFHQDDLHSSGKYPPGNSFVLPNGMYVAPTYGVDGMIKKPKVSRSLLTSTTTNTTKQNENEPSPVSTQLFINSQNVPSAIPNSNSKFKSLPRDQGIKMTEIRFLGLPLSNDVVGNNNTSTCTAADQLQQQQQQQQQPPASSVTSSTTSLSQTPQNLANEQQQQQSQQDSGIFSNYTIVDVHLVNQNDSVSSSAANNIFQQQQQQAKQSRNVVVNPNINLKPQNLTSPNSGGTVPFHSASSNSGSVEFNNNNNQTSSVSTKLGGLLIVLMEGLVIHIPARAFSINNSSSMQQQVFIPVGGNLGENSFILASANTNNNNNTAGSEGENNNNNQSPLTADTIPPNSTTSFASSGATPNSATNNNNKDSSAAAITQILNIQMNQLEAVWQIPWNCCCSSVDSSSGIPHTVFCGFPCGLILSMPIGQHCKTIVAAGKQQSLVSSSPIGGIQQQQSPQVILPSNTAKLSSTTSIPIISASTPSKQPIPAPTSQQQQQQQQPPQSSGSHPSEQHQPHQHHPLQKNQLTSVLSMSNLPNLVSSTPPGSVPQSNSHLVPSSALPSFATLQSSANNNNTNNSFPNNNNNQQLQQQIREIAPPIIPASTYASALTVSDAPTKISTIYYSHDKVAVIVGTKTNSVLVDKLAFEKASFSKSIQNVQMLWGLQASCLCMETFQASATSTAWAVVTDTGSVFLFSIDSTGTVSKCEFRIVSPSSATSSASTSLLPSGSSSTSTPQASLPTTTTTMQSTNTTFGGSSATTAATTTNNPPRFVKIVMDSDEGLCVIVIHENGSVTICDKSRRHVHAAFGSGGTTIRVQSAHQVSSLRCSSSSLKSVVNAYNSKQSNIVGTTASSSNPNNISTPSRIVNNNGELIPNLAIRRSQSNVALNLYNNANNNLLQPSQMLSQGMTTTASSIMFSGNNNNNNNVSVPPVNSAIRNKNIIELLIVDNCYIRKVLISLPALAFSHRANSAAAWAKLSKFSESQIALANKTDQNQQDAGNIHATQRHISIFTLGNSLFFDNAIVEQIRLEKRLIQQRHHQKQQQQHSVIKKGSEVEEEERRKRNEQQQQLGGSFVNPSNNNGNRTQTSTSLNLEEFEE